MYRWADAAPLAGSKTNRRMEEAGTNVTGLRFFIQLRLGNYMPQQGVGAAHDGAAGAQQLTGAGAQHGSGTVQHELLR